MNRETPTFSLLPPFQREGTSLRLFPSLLPADHALVNPKPPCSLTRFRVAFSPTPRHWDRPNKVTSPSTRQASKASSNSSRRSFFRSSGVRFFLKFFFQLGACSSGSISPSTPLSSTRCTGYWNHRFTGTNLGNSRKVPSMRQAVKLCTAFRASTTRRKSGPN